MLIRLFGNTNENCVPDGSLLQNGSGKFNDITATVLTELKKLSITHIWFTGVIRHATEGDCGVKGRAGSPYAISDYHDVNSYLAEDCSNRIGEFEALVSRTHEAGLGVVIDFVPNHLARDEHSGSFTDINFYPGRIHDGDWTDTVKLNYNEHDTWAKMTEILIFWAGKGVDGFRCDMVELVPVEFWEWCIPQVKAQYPDIIFIAEIYQPHNYHSYFNRGGFNYLYDKSAFYDTLRDISMGYKPASAISAAWQSLGDFQPRMLNFLENHDEVRLASDFFLGSPFKGIPALFTSLFFNTAPFMLYFGQEFGERGMDQEGFSGMDGRTTIYDFWSLSSIRRWLNGVKQGSGEMYLTTSENEIYYIYREMLHNAMAIPSIRYGKVYDLEYVNPFSDFFNPTVHFAFLRGYESELYLFVANFSDQDAHLQVTIPFEALKYFGRVSLSDERVGIEVTAYSGEFIRL